MRDEQKGGSGLAVLLAVLVLALFSLFSLGAIWFVARSQAQKALTTEAELSREEMAEPLEPDVATTPMD